MNRQTPSLLSGGLRSMAGDSGPARDFNVLGYVMTVLRSVVKEKHRVT